MESFNRVLYFILGLVVVLVFIIVFTGRLNLGKTFRPLAGNSTTPTPTPVQKVEEKKGFFSFLNKPSATPTPAKAKVTPTPGQAMSGTGTKGGVTTSQTSQTQTTTKGGVTNVQSIPATGSPVEILYLAIPTLSAGFYLRKRS